MGMGRGPGGPMGMLAQETSKPVNPSVTLGRLFKEFKPYSAILILVLITILANAWVQVISPDLTGQIVDCYLSPAIAQQVQSQAGMPAAIAGGTARLSQSGQNNCWYTQNPGDTKEEILRGLGGLILLITGLFVVGAIMGGLQFFLMSWAGQHVLKDLRVRVFDHLHSLSLKFFNENEAGNLMSRITNDMETLQQALGFALVNVTSGLVLLVWVAITMLSKSVPYALVGMAAVPLMVLATNWFSSRARQAFRVARKEIGRVSANLEESISGVREVQAFSREEQNIEAFRESSASYRDANIRAVAYTSALSPTLEALGYLAMALVTVVGGVYILNGRDFFGTSLSLGLVITFMGYVQRFNQPIQQISTLWANIQSAIAGAERIFSLLDTMPDVVDAHDAIEMPPIQGRVEFDHVYAEYVEGVPVLEDVSFTAEKGQTIAIVGPTGAGKTTIINLIPRFYDVTRGQIRIDGIDISRVRVDSLRRQIGIVLQDTFLFSDTVMNNIRFGKPDASDEEVIAAAQLARADDFIRRLPQGYETVLGEHGAGLSQGQRQLIAIARAALINPRILILDEATSSVDTRTERQIQVALENLLRGRTSFVIAHRLSTIRNADQILVVENGRIVERGRHEELLEKRGAYYALYMKQFVQNGAPSGAGFSASPQPA